MSKEIIIILMSTLAIIIVIMFYFYKYFNSTFIKTEILFGRNFIDKRELTEDEFNTFVDEIATKYFPYGLTTRISTGQMFDGNKIEKQRNFELLIIHKNDYTEKENIEKIIQIFKKKYRELQVIMFQQNISVNFYNR